MRNTSVEVPSTDHPFWPSYPQVVHKRSAEPLKSLRRGRRSEHLLLSFLSSIMALYEIHLKNKTDIKKHYIRNMRPALASHGFKHHHHQLIAGAQAFLMHYT
jgi:hypothetical protein